MNGFFKDMTIDAVNAAMEAEAAGRRKRPPSLKCSTLGHPCPRKLWLEHRCVSADIPDATGLRAMEDGNHCEWLEGQRLTKVGGVELRTTDPKTGQQFEVLDIDGHLKGRLDGVIRGLPQDAGNIYIWECKAVSEKSIAALTKAKIKVGELEALQEWDAVYYGQAQLYMHLSEIPRHYMTVTSPGGRHTISVITKLNQPYADGLIEKAKNILNATTPPRGISADASDFRCNFCGVKEVCQGQGMPLSGCRTCVHSTPIKGGEWFCEKYKKPIPKDFELKGCDKHLFIPDLLGFAKAVASGVDTVTYAYKGATFTNGCGDGHYKSSELANITDINAIGNSDIENLREMMGAKHV
jgi:hypothetical protein